MFSDDTHTVFFDDFCTAFVEVLAVSHDVIAYKIILNKHIRFGKHLPDIECNGAVFSCISVSHTLDTEETECVCFSAAGKISDKNFYIAEINSSISRPVINLIKKHDR